MGWQNVGQRLPDGTGSAGDPPALAIEVPRETGAGEAPALRFVPSHPERRRMCVGGGSTEAILVCVVAVVCKDRENAVSLCAAQYQLSEGRGGLIGLKPLLSEAPFGLLTACGTDANR